MIRHTFQIYLLVIISLSFGAPAPAQSPTHAANDWKQNILIQIPREFNQLQDKIGQWQGSYTLTIESFGPAGGDIPVRSVVAKTNYFYKKSIDGMKLAGPVSPPGSEEITAGNSKYDFSLEMRPSNPAFYITQYSPVAKHRVSDNRLLCAAYELCGAKLPDLIDGKAGQLTAVTSINSHDKLMLRLEFQRKFQSTAKLYPAWALVDPNFHYAIVQYHQQYAWGYKRGTVEYQHQIADVALPKKMVEEDVDSQGRVAKKYITEFGPPQPCQAKAADFTLEAFGLERPSSIHKSGYSLFTTMNITVLAALGLLFCWLAYRSRKKKPANGP